MIQFLEAKLDASEKDYKEKHKDDFNKQKMVKYINRKLKNEISGLVFLNLAPSIQIIKSERFK